VNGLAGRVSLVLLTALVGSLGLWGVLLERGVAGRLERLARESHAVEARSIRRETEDLLARGMALRQLDEVQAAIDRIMAEDPDLLGIDVFDSQGEILFDSDPAAVGTLVAPDWLRAVALGGRQLFDPLVEEGRGLGLTLVNSLGQVDGGVILRYPIPIRGAEMVLLAAPVARPAVLLLAVAALLALLGPWVLTGPLTRRLTRLEMRVAALARGEAKSVAGEEAAMEGEPDTSVDVASRHLVAALADMRCRADALDRLDRLA
jgi:hypothetical protein